MAALTSDGFFAHAAQLADALPDGIVVVDPDGTAVAINSRLLTMTGYAETELVGSSIDRLVPVDRRALHAARRAEFIAHPQVRPMGSALDIVCLRSDGTLFPADISLSPITLDGESFVVATVHDVTERRAVEDARRDAEERFRLLVESASSLAIFDLDPEGRVSSWNDGAQRLKGYDRNEIVGKHYSVFYTPEDVATDKPQRLLAEAARRGRVEEFGTRVRKDGSRFQATVSITASTDSDGHVRGFTKIVRDNSAALQARDELERLHLVEQRVHIGRDLHDGAIQAMFAVGMGLQALASDIDDAAATERLQQFVVALDDTITELRGFIIGLSNDLTPIQVRAEMERLMEGLRSRTGMRATLNVEPTTLAALGTNSRNLLLVVREAVSNVERHSRASVCTASLQPGTDHSVELIVQDDGRGFDPTRFSAGLGLNNARSRAVEMGATYLVASSPGGTTVTLRIPTPDRV
ncbi:MAG: PAS domain S-box protein [Candidatus Dormibacter sp.]